MNDKKGLMFRGVAIGAVFILGVIVPFVDLFVVVEVFYLSIPLAMLSVGSLFCIIAGLFGKMQDSGRLIYASWIVIIFVASQFLSCFVVSKVQRSRAESYIKKIESTTDATNSFSKDISTPIGISFIRLNQGDFRISYARGFMISEIYDSKIKSWKSYGWND